MLTVPSSNPLVITEDSIEKTYDKWAAPHVVLVENGEVFKLIMSFQRYREEGGELIAAPFGQKEFVCENVLEDATLGPLAASFFQAIVTKAFQTGILT